MASGAWRAARAAARTILLAEACGVLRRMELEGHVRVGQRVARGCPAHEGVGPPLGLVVLPLQAPGERVLRAAHHLLRLLEDAHHPLF